MPVEWIAEPLARPRVKGETPSFRAGFTGSVAAVPLAALGSWKPCAGCLRVGQVCTVLG